jgi:hypothetical protein
MGLSKELEYLAKKIDEAGLTIKFGLEQQGHIETIEEILDDFGSNDYSWQKIADKIGWCKNAARDHYIEYLRESVGK